MANVSPKIVLAILFFTMSSADIDFLGWELQWKTYTTEEALLTTRHVKLVGKKEFAAATFNSEHEIYVVHIASLSSTLLIVFNVYLSRRSWISGLIVEEIPTKVPAEYLAFADVLSPDLTSELLEHIGINDYAIKLVGSQQPSYSPIYSLGPVEMETLKAYIETNLANGFIRPSKLPAGIPILFDQKSDSFLRLYVDYQGLNNFMIKNRYPLPLIGELLDRLRRA